MSGWLVQWADLSPDQRRAVELDVSSHQIIIGAPGSGKTLILAHRAKRLQIGCNVPNDRFRVFVFTNTLRDYIRNGLAELRVPEENVLTFDYWCREFYDAEIGGRVPGAWVPRRRGGSIWQPNFQAIREAVLDRLCSDRRLQFRYEFVLVDEGQDLDAISFDIIRLIARHVTVCVDRKQSIYENGSTETGIREKLGLRGGAFYVLEAYRCCPHITELASRFLDNPKERSTFLHQAKTEQTRKEVPLLYKATDFNDEREHLWEMLRLRQTAGDRIAILLPRKEQVYGFAKGMREAGLEVESPDSRHHSGGYDFSSPLPKVMSYWNAKGLTFNSVLMPRLVPESFSRCNPDRLSRLLFVGITRATDWAYLSTVRGNICAAIRNLDTTDCTTFLAVREGTGAHRDWTTEGEDVTLSQSEDLSDLV